MTDEYDDENPRWTKADFARARGPEAMTATELAAFPNTKRIGRPLKETPKVPVNLRLDADVVEHFKAAGAGWQTRMNAALQEAAKRERSAEVVGELTIGVGAVVTEEVSLRKEIGLRPEQVHNTVRHTEIEIEGPSHVRARRYVKAPPPRPRR